MIRLEIPCYETSDDLPVTNASELVAETYSNLTAFPNQDGDRVILSIGNYPSSYQTCVDPDTAEAFAIKILQAAHIASKIRFNREEKAA